MRKLFLVTALATSAVAWGASLAFATVHPLANSECSAAAANGTAADLQDPPGITNEGHTPGYTDPDPDHATQAQPVISILTNSTTKDFAAWKAPGCPAPNK